MGLMVVVEVVHGNDGSGGVVVHGNDDGSCGISRFLIL